LNFGLSWVDMFHSHLLQAFFSIFPIFICGVIPVAPIFKLILQQMQVQSLVVFTFRVHPNLLFDGLSKVYQASVVFTLEFTDNANK